MRDGLAVKGVLLSAVSLACGALFLSLTITQPPFVLWISIAAAMVGFLAGTIIVDESFLLVGTALCTLPLFGPGVLSVFFAGWLAGVPLGEARNLTPVVRREGRLSVIAAYAAALFLAAIFCGVVASWVATFDPLLWETLSAEGWRHALRYVSETRVAWHRAILGGAGYLLASAAMLTVLGMPRPRLRVVNLCWGLLAGVLVAAVVLALQKFGVGGIPAMNLTPFWRFVQRYPASFSDPNAFGIMVFLIFPLFLYARHEVALPVFFAAAVALLALSLWSGSRTLYLGLLLWGIAASFWYLRRLGKPQVTRFFAVGLSLAALFAIFLGAPPVNRTLIRFIPVPSAQRILHTLNWTDCSQMLNSRALYNRIGSEAWRSAPLTGVGFERFYEVQASAAARLGIDLNGWVDNANNFYLGILAECGALGFLLTCAAIFLLGWIVANSQYSGDDCDAESSERLRWYLLSILAVFGLLLFTGPHLAFEEVRYLFFLLLGFALRGPLRVGKPAQQFVVRLSAALLFIVPVVYLWALAVGERPIRTLGFYPSESESGIPFSWTGTRALVPLCAGRPVKYEVRAVHPSLASEPVRVTASVSSGEAVEVVLQTPAWQPLEIPNASQNAAAVITVSRAWSPADSGSHDPRILGVMLRPPPGACPARGD